MNTTAIPNRFFLTFLFIGMFLFLSAQNPEYRGVIRMNNTTGSQPAEKNYLLLIGIDNYPNWLNLRNAVNGITFFYCAEPLSPFRFPPICLHSYLLAQPIPEGVFSQKIRMVFRKDQDTPVDNQ